MMSAKYGARTKKFYDINGKMLPHKYIYQMMSVTIRNPKNIEISLTPTQNIDTTLTRLNKP